MALNPNRPPLVMLDPTAERQPVNRPRQPRPRTLTDLTVGLLDIAKMRGDVFLDRVAELLADRGVTTVRFRKPTFTKPAPVDLRREITQQCHVVIEALAD